jgi:hypothetical protein
MFVDSVAYQLLPGASLLEIRQHEHRLDLSLVIIRISNSHVKRPLRGGY